MRELGMTRAMLIFELIVLFVGLPLAYRFSPVRVPALPLLWLVAGYAWWQLVRDPSFDHRRLWNTAPLGSQLGGILSIFLVVAVVLWAGVHWLAPRLEWGFARQHPAFWALVMVCCTRSFRCTRRASCTGLFFFIVMPACFRQHRQASWRCW